MTVVGIAGSKLFLKAKTVLKINMKVFLPLLLPV